MYLSGAYASETLFMHYIGERPFAVLKVKPIPGYIWSASNSGISFDILCLVSEIWPIILWHSHEKAA